MSRSNSDRRHDPRKSKQPKQRPGKQHRRRLRLESLECRRVLATYFVGSTADDPDSTCIADDQAGSSSCTIRSAIAAASNTPDDDTILIEAGTYSLSPLLGGLNYAELNTSGTPTGDLAIVGDSDDPSAVVLDGANESRILAITGTGTASELDLRLSGLTFVNGVADDGPGGALFVFGTSIQITDSVIRSNFASFSGGGIGAEQARVSIFDSMIFDNDADTGGGIYIEGIDSNLTIENSVIAGNQAFANTGFGGGGIRSVDADVIINSSTVDNNVTGGGHGGGIQIQGEAGGSLIPRLSLNGTTISNNRTESFAGGIDLQNAAIAVVNSTISGNQASGNGGGIYMRDSAADFSFSTISSNSAGSGANLATIAGSIQSRGTIFAGEESALDPDTVVISNGDNLDSGNSLRLDPLVDQLNTDPLLGLLRDNGGPVMTQALLPGSPAIDSAVLSDSVLTDARGVTRPQDGDGDGNFQADRGAYETNPLLNDFAAISGITFDDLNGNGIRDAGEPVLPNATVSLYRETNINGQFDDDTLPPANRDRIVSTILSDASGFFRFVGLDGPDNDNPAGAFANKNPDGVGTYWLVQDQVTGRLQVAAIEVTITDDTGVDQVVIDDFEDTPGGSQIISESAAGTYQNSSGSGLLYSDELVTVRNSGLNPARRFDVAFGELFNELQSGDAQIPGLIDEVGGSQTPDPSDQVSHIGFVELFTVTMQAVAPGLAQFATDPSETLGSETTVIGSDAGLTPSEIRFARSELLILPASSPITMAIDDSFPDGQDSDGNLISSTMLQPARLDVLANDVLSETSPGVLASIIQFGLFENPTLGDAFINDNGTPTTLVDDFISYRANEDSVGSDSFRYFVITDDGVRSTATVNISLSSNGGMTFDNPTFGVFDDGFLRLTIPEMSSVSGRLQYDGVDADDAGLVLSAEGLGAINLSGGDPGAGIELIASSDREDDAILIRVYTDDDEFSSAEVVLDGTGALTNIFIPFTEFAVETGPAGPADFTNVGAIEIIIQPDVVEFNAAIDSIVSRRSNETVVDIANIIPVTLGGSVFIDNSVEGQNNGLLDAGEGFLDSVTIDLYRLEEADGSVVPLLGVPIDSQTTDNGDYQFSGLLPGHYAVAIPLDQFAVGGPLFGFANSTGNDPPPDPDDDVDNDDNGIVLDTSIPNIDGTVLSETITLVSQTEPVAEDDDPDTNLTLDFGFFSQADLTINKSVDISESNLIAGGTAVFEFTVTNDGPLSASAVTVSDLFPTGLGPARIQNASGEFALITDGNLATVLLGNLAPNTSGTFELVADIAAGQTDDVTNTATVFSGEVDPDTTTNSSSVLIDIDSQTASIAGAVYVDANNNGIRDAEESPIADVTVSLTGTDVFGNGIMRSFMTDTDGNYRFAGLAAGTYTVMESQPAGFNDAMDTLGSGATATAGNDVFSDLVLIAGASAVDFNFGEQFPPIHRLSTGDGDGDTTIDVDAFGSFGTDNNAFNGVADFDPVGTTPAASAIFRSALAFRESAVGVRSFLDEINAASASSAILSGDATSVTSTFSIGPFGVRLVQTVLPNFAIDGRRNGAQLQQVYTFTNTSPVPAVADVVRYVDADLFYDGTRVDGGGLLRDSDGNLVLFETDSGGTGATDVTFFGIRDAGGTAPSDDRFMIEDFEDLALRIAAGTELQNSIDGDNNGDEFIDAGQEYDVSLALRRLLDVAAGGSIEYSSTFLLGGQPEMVVPRQSDLSVSTARTDGNGPIPRIGDTLTFSITASNAGPSTATEVSIVQSLPSGLAFASGVGPNGEALQAANGTVTVSGVNIPVDQSVSLSVSARVVAGGGQDLTSTASVSSNIPDDNPSNNTASVIVPISPASLIGGHVFCDQNGNGTEDFGELLVNVGVFADANGNRRHDSGEMRTTTGDDGNFGFNTLPQGEFVLVAEIPETCVTIPDNPGVVQTSFDVGTLASSIAAVNRDSDSDLDLVVANDLDGSIRTLINQSGDLVDGPVINVGPRLQKVAAPRVPISGSPAGTIAAVGIGNGGNDRGNLYFGENSFQSFRTGNGPIDVLIDDLDGDGRPELVTASFRSSSLEILSPAGGSLPPTLNTSTAQLVSIASGDLNGDERVDLVAGGYGYDPGGTNIVGFETDSQINVLLNEGDGEFTLLESNDSTLRGRFVAIEVSDLDGNGVAEILAISRVGESDSVLNVYRVNDQSLQRISSIPVTPKASAMDDGDLNGDGLADVVITSESEGTVAFYLGDGQGVFQQIQLIDNIPVPIDLTLVDLESDNRAEVAVVNQFKGFNGSMPTPGSTVTLLRLQVAEQVVLVGQDPVTADFSFPSAVLRPRMDVNADRSITVLDALRVINAIGEPPLPASSAGEGEAVSRLWRATDVDLDGATTARDALLIINQLARQTHDEVVAGSSFVSSNDDDDNDRYHDAVDEVMAGKLF